MNKFDSTSSGTSDLWIRWDGGECPVDTSRKYEVKFRSGEVSDQGGDWAWAHSDWDTDITYYRYTDTPTIAKPEATVEHTGGSSSYYTVKVAYPIATYGLSYTAECIDLQEALDMTPAEANAFKAIWRTAAARQGKKKCGNNAIYDAEKCVFFSERMLAKAKREDV